MNYVEELARFVESSRRLAGVEEGGALALSTAAYFHICAYWSIKHPGPILVKGPYPPGEVAGIVPLRDASLAHEDFSGPSTQDTRLPMVAVWQCQVDGDRKFITRFEKWITVPAFLILRGGPWDGAEMPPTSLRNNQLVLTRSKMEGELAIAWSDHAQKDAFPVGYYVKCNDEPAMEWRGRISA